MKQPVRKFLSWLGITSQLSGMNVNQGEPPAGFSHVIPSTRSSSEVLQDLTYQVISFANITFPQTSVLRCAANTVSFLTRSSSYFLDPKIFGWREPLL